MFGFVPAVWANADPVASASTVITATKMKQTRMTSFIFPLCLRHNSKGTVGSELKSEHQLLGSMQFHRLRCFFCCYLQQV